MGFGGPEFDLYTKQTEDNVVFPEYYETENPRAGMTFNSYHFLNIIVKDWIR